MACPPSRPRREPMRPRAWLARSASAVSAHSISGYFAITCRAMSICSSCTRAYPESRTLAGMYTDQNCPPTIPALSRARSVCPGVVFRRSYFSTSCRATESLRIVQGKSLCPSMSGVWRSTRRARARCGSLACALNGSSVNVASSRRIVSRIVSMILGFRQLLRPSAVPPFSNSTEHINLRRATARGHLPARLHGLAADPVHHVEEVHHDADVIWNDPHAVADGGTPVGSGQIEQAVLLRHCAHDDLVAVVHDTEAVVVGTTHWLASE